jgi:glycosyltransferase involved in cell wall biosynthesis
VVPLALEPEPESDRPSGGCFQAAPRVVLTGNLGYFVNRDATRWALRQLWPRLRAARPEVELVVAGARPDAGLRRELVGAGVRLVADPPDLGAVLAGASVALAPMRCGSGTPVKVLEAWAAGVPVVASPYAAAGTEAVAGRELLVAERPDEWINSILQLLDEPAMGARLSAAGRRLLEREHSLRRVREALATVLDAATGPLC